MAAPIGNKYGLGNHTAGRPPIYKDPDELNNKIIEYFTWCEGESHIEKVTRRRKQKDPATGKNKFVEVVEDEVVWDRMPERPKWTKLALFLGFESRKSLHDYSKKDAFSYPIKRALLIIESVYEDSLENASVAGVIFALKNLGWVDQQDVKHSGEVKTNDLTNLSTDELRKLRSQLQPKKAK